MDSVTAEEKRQKNKESLWIQENVFPRLPHLKPVPSNPFQYPAQYCIAAYRRTTFPKALDKFLSYLMRKALYEFEEDIEGVKEGAREHKAKAIYLQETETMKIVYKEKVLLFKVAAQDWKNEAHVKKAYLHWCSYANGVAKFGVIGKDPAKDCHLFYAWVLCNHCPYEAAVLWSKEIEMAQEKFALQHDLKEDIKTQTVPIQEYELYRDIYDTQKNALGCSSEKFKEGVVKRKAYSEVTKEPDLEGEINRWIHFLKKY